MMSEGKRADRTFNIYIGECFDVDKGEYVKLFETEIGPVIAHNRAQEAAILAKYHAKNSSGFDLDNIRVRKIVAKTTFSEPMPLDEVETALLKKYAGA